jgi:hypothetical protein
MGDAGGVIDTAPKFLTDFPEPGVTIWYTNKTALLPSEY